jgi:uncharacterized membrane protein YcaP (DUF421 family)
MNNILEMLFGKGTDLEPLQMGLRAFVIFFIALILIRFSGKRTLGNHSAFDFVLVIMLGAILARAVVGASPFIPTVTAAFVIALIHRALAMLTVSHPGIGSILNGKEYCLYKDGIINEKSMKICNLSMLDLMEAVRLEGNVNSLDPIKEIWMERNGRISVVKKTE